MLRPVGVKASRRIRDRAETMLHDVLAAALRSYLRDVQRAALDGLPPVLTAAAAAPVLDPLPGGDVPTLGASAGRWAAGVEAGTAEAVRAAFAMVWARYTDRDLSLTSPALSAMEAYVLGVRDRLVRGTHFGVTVYGESFEAVRRSLAQSVAQGWTRQELAARIAAELSWEGNGSYWREVQARADLAIDTALDALGPPGTPAREWSRLNDRAVQALRDERNLAIRHLDAERSVWQTRAMLISRTESTGLTTYSAQAALQAEDVATKVWMATNDARTRPSHRAADGQEVPLQSAFVVGGAAMQRPGDPAGPVAESAACRCTIIGGDSL